MPFFNGPKSKLPQNLQNVQNTKFFDPTDYYIGKSVKGIDASNIVVSNATSSGPSDHELFYGNIQAAKLHITYAAQNEYTITFPAILDSYSETFSPTFNQEQLYGRMDPVQKYQNTSRTINVTFKVLAYDENHSSRNLHALSTLTQFLYPVYNYSNSHDVTNNATAISQSPLWRVKFANIIQSTKINKNIKETTYANTGLLVAPTQFNFQPNLEAGFFIMDKTFLFPKEIKLTLAFNVVHENTLGWITANNVNYDWIGNITEDSGIVDVTSKIFPWGDNELGELIGVAEALSDEAEVEQQLQNQPTTTPPSS